MKAKVFAQSGSLLERPRLPKSILSGALLARRWLQVILRMLQELLRATNVQTYATRRTLRRPEAFPRQSQVMGSIAPPRDQMWREKPAEKDHLVSHQVRTGEARGAAGARLL